MLQANRRIVRAVGVGAYGIQRVSRSAEKSEKPTTATPPSEDDKRQEALDVVMETVQALFEERGEEDKV